ncbi:flagellar hook-basal body complex protein [Desulfobacula sp.]|uniref:flagellar hook-basal body complex protein n=1 Tax=Desulfobacula sp. TaxID=2593537 RepID=UPI00261AF7A5|nr:flagellar hook-basal body complex protein [Desulfobacula sp.]
MSLSSSLFTGTSGLKNMGNALQVVGNNISNLNTVGFKKGRSIFADTLYESLATQAGTGQVGRGMSIGDVTQNFGQGSFESTGNTTDLSIGGDGFFIMRQSNSENKLYSRAGNFFFDKTGQLVNPEGYIVQGWDLDEETSEDMGAIKDLVLNAFTSPPKKSSSMTVITNLDADTERNAVVLSNNWDSSAETYMEANNYEYQTVTKVYDALGSAHDITLFYDKKSGTEWEYTVTCNPEEDNRNSVQGTDSKGLLARGTITFNQSSGDILNLTMSEFTGRLGNFQANGLNTTENIHYQIVNHDEMPLDGYGFEFVFDGSSWDFVDVNQDGIIDAGEKPENYANATIVYSDNQEIHIVMNQEVPTQIDPDIKIKLDQPPVVTDVFGFDINGKNNLHVQNISGTQYYGDTANDNTTLEINDPSVITHDANDLAMVWNPNAGGTGKWSWSNPTIAEAAGTLVSGITLDGTSVTPAATTVINNAEDLIMVATDIQLRFDGTSAWDWNDAIKEEDFISTYNFVPSNDPSLKITNPGAEGAMATTLSPTLVWTGTEWTLPSGLYTDTIGNATLTIDTANSNSMGVAFDIFFNDITAATTARYTFGSALTSDAGQSLSFAMDPTPPREYADATLITSGTIPTNGFALDFDGDNTRDITFDPAAGGTLNGGSKFVFSVNPDVPPTGYGNATLRGDQDEVIIDLDGSGNEADNEDIRFVFEDSLRFGSNTHPYNDRSKIDFDIVGSTAWTEISTSDIEKTGYFSFTTDFLEGEFGTTENKIALDLGAAYKGTNFVNNSLSTTQYSKSSSTVFQDSDGYSASDLQSVDVASDGILTGIYSNGELIPLFRVGLAKFLNNYGLSNQGGNLFSETRDSGNAITNIPGENGLGTIAPNSLELSNVDISEEFVSLITNQRGFEANSKTITTVDAMMQTVIQMKR